MLALLLIEFRSEKVAVGEHILFSLLLLLGVFLVLLFPVVLGVNLGYLFEVFLVS